MGQRAMRSFFGSNSIDTCVQVESLMREIEGAIGVVCAAWRTSDLSRRSRNGVTICFIRDMKPLSSRSDLNEQVRGQGINAISVLLT
jgi:hypothetical protein